MMVPKVSSHANSVSSHPVVNTRQLSEVGPLSKIPDGSYEKETKELRHEITSKRRKLTPGSSQRLDLFIKVLRLLCP